MSKYGLILLSGLFLINPVVYAEDDSGSTKFVLEAGLHAGGDKLATVYFTDGSSKTINAGDGLSLSLGAKLGLSETMSAVITYGIKEDKVSASDGDISFTRNPLDALLLFKSDKWQYGAGLTYHTGVKFKVATAYTNYTVDFKSALGAILDARYFFSDSAYVGGRYTIINYETETTGKSFSGNSIGVVVGIYI